MFQICKFFIAVHPRGHSDSRPQSPAATWRTTPPAPGPPGGCRLRLWAGVARGKKAPGRLQHHGHILFLRTLQANSPGGGRSVLFLWKVCTFEIVGQFLPRTRSPRVLRGAGTRSKLLHHEAGRAGPDARLFRSEKRRLDAPSAVSAARVPPGRAWSLAPSLACMRCG